MKLRDITDIKRAEEQYKTIVRTALDGFWLTDIKGQLLDVNEAYCQLIGYSREELLTMNISDIEAVERAEETAKHIKKVIKMGGDRFETHHRRKNGTIVDLEVSVNCLDEEGGRLFVFLRDITERKQAEAVLRESEIKLNIAQVAEKERKRLYDVLETLPAYVVLLDKDYHVPFANRFFRERFGESNGKRCFEYLFNLTEPCENCETYKVLKTNVPHHWEWTGPDGRIYDINDFQFPDNDGSTMILEMGIDITERKQAEAALRKAHNELEKRVQERTKELKESEEKYSRIVQTANEGILVFDLEGKINFANQRIAEMLGYANSDELMGLVGLEEFVEPDQKPEIMKTREQLKMGLSLQHEFKFRRKDGSILWVNASISPLLDNQRHHFANLAMYTDITDRKKAEKALHESEERFRSLFTTMDEGAVLHDMIYDASGNARDYRILEVNPSFERITGIKREQAIGALASELYRAGEPPYLAIYSRVAETGNPEVFETHFAPMQKSFRISVFSPGKGQFATIFEDITELKRVAEVLQQSERQLARAQEIAHLGSWELDLVNNRLTWSDEVYRIFGLKPQEFGATYEAFLDAVHPEDRAAVDAAYSGSLREGRDSYEIEHRVVRKSSGEIRFVHERCQHVRNEDGKIIRSVGMVHDITERKQMENQLVHLASFPTLNPNPIVELDMTGAISYLNPVAKKIPGLATAGIEHPLLADINNIIENLRSGKENYMRRDVKLDDSWYDQMIYPVKEYPGFRIYMRDITERKKTEEELKRSNENLVQFAYVASHDLQEPLRTMASFSQLLASRYKTKLDKDADEFIHFITDGAQRMQNLITDILAYSRAGTTLAVDSKIDCNQVLSKVITSMSEPIVSNHAVITHDTLPVLTFNENNLIQLFQNFISNAIKFRREEPPLVHISAQKQKAEWVFAVSDNGIGIDDKYCDKIFLIFQRLHARDKYSGTGIGLSICKKIVEMHGGRIWVESALGKGSTFFFTIPIKTAKEV